MATYQFTAKQAARIYNRLMRPISRHFDQAYVADSQYDGGEWSCQAIGEAEDDEQVRVLKMVSNRTGVELKEVEAEVLHQEYYGNLYCM